jgi:hypothetical protein
MLLTWQQLGVIIALLFGLLLLLFRNQERLVRWSDAHVRAQIHRRLAGRATPEPAPPNPLRAKPVSQDPL